MILNLCNKIINNLGIKKESIQKDITALVQIVNNIQESISTESSMLDSQTKNNINNSLNNILDGIDDMNIFINEIEPDIKLMKNNIDVINDAIYAHNEKKK